MASADVIDFPKIQLSLPEKYRRHGHLRVFLWGYVVMSTGPPGGVESDSDAVSGFNASRIGNIVAPTSEILDRDSDFEIGEKLVIMVDRAATHNFISDTGRQKLGLLMVKTNCNGGVFTVNGFTGQRTGISTDVELTKTTQDYYCDFIAFAINAPELMKQAWEMAFMIGLKVKMRTRVNW